MKRNWDTIREILLRIEELEQNEYFTLSDFNENREYEIIHHVKMLKEAGYIEAEIAETTGGTILDIERLTWQGNDFIESIRDVKTWEKTKMMIADKGGAMTFEIVKASAVKIITTTLFGL
ncbi:MAG: DUF2513 domain-containing protein [Methylococcales bacterium]|nr:DUF2513 domain-containing protein [Methylococcales bacterium]